MLNMEIYNIFIKILEKITDWAGTQLKIGLDLFWLEFILKCNISFFKPWWNRFCRGRTHSETWRKKKEAQFFVFFLISCYVWNSLHSFSCTFNTLLLSNCVRIWEKNEETVGNPNEALKECLCSPQSFN